MITGRSNLDPSASQADVDDVDAQAAARALDYASPVPRPAMPSPISAVMLCLPGVICWCILLGTVLQITKPRSAQSPFASFMGAIGGAPLLMLWFIAVITAIVSIVIYWRKSKPWYVCINLFINSAGLLFTGVILCLIVIVLAGVH